MPPDIFAQTGEANPPGRISQAERFDQSSARYADLGGAQLASIRRAAERGELYEWAGYGDSVLSGSDGWLAGKFRARAMRVSQAEYKIVPATDRPRDKLAAELCEQGIRRIRHFQRLLMVMLDAVPMGASFHHLTWGNFGANYFPAKVEWVHLRRFRYDLQWQPRLWDKGATAGADGYGKILDPGEYLIHQHVTRGVYPGLYGELHGCSKLALFMSWCQLWWLTGSEKYGHPIIWAEVPTDFKAESRAAVKQMLTDIMADRTGYAQEGTKLHVETSAAAARVFENFSEFLAFAKAQLTEQILGTSDAAGPGENGSNAAVSTRMGALTDPIMIADGAELAETIEEYLLRWMVYFNRHRFGPGELPETPQFRFLTADDEVKVDQGDKAQEVAVSSGASADDAKDAAPVAAVAPAPAVQASREVAAPAGNPFALGVRRPKSPTLTLTKPPTT